MTDSKTVVEDLAAWLTAVWDEEERLAKAVKPLGEVVVMGGERHPETFGHVRYTVASADGYPRTLSDPEASRHFAYHDPASVLARIAAYRKILALHNRLGDYCNTCGGQWPCLTLLLLASPYADRPDFRPEWLVERQGVAVSDDIDLSDYEDSDDVCSDCGALKLDDVCEDCGAM